MTDPAVTAKVVDDIRRRCGVRAVLGNGHGSSSCLDARLEHRVRPFLKVERLIPGRKILEDMREVHVRPVPEVVTRSEIHVPERLVVGDLARAERSLLRRREAQEQLGVVGNQVRPLDTRSLGHPLRQARARVEVAADEPAPDARRTEDARAVEERALGVPDVLADVAAQEHGDVVLLEGRLARIAGEPDRIGERAHGAELGPRGATVERQMHACLPRHVAAKVWETPGDGDPESGRRRRIASVELEEHLLELALRPSDVVSRHTCRDDGVVKRRYDDRHAVVSHDRDAVEQMLLGVNAAAGASQTWGRGDAVDQLVETDRAEAARRRSNEHLPAGETHLGLRPKQDETVEHPIQVPNDTCVPIRRRDVLADRVQGSVALPRIEHVPLIRALVRRVDACGDVRGVRLALRIREARNRLVRIEVRARRNLCAAGIAAKVHVHLAGARLAPEEADQIAAIVADGFAVAVIAADACVERVRHPGRAVHRCLDAVGERLPTGSPGSGARPWRFLCGRIRAVRRPAARDHEHEHRERKGPPHATFIACKSQPLARDLWESGGDDSRGHGPR